MKLVARPLLLLQFILLLSTGYAQNISSENIEIQVLQQPRTLLDPASRTYKVTVTSPYNLTKDDIIRQSKADHQKALDNYDKLVLESEKEHQKKLKNYDDDVKKAREKYDLEREEFKKKNIARKISDDRTR